MYNDCPICKKPLGNEEIIAGIIILGCNFCSYCIYVSSKGIVEEINVGKYEVMSNKDGRGIYTDKKICVEMNWVCPFNKIDTIEKIERILLLS